MNVSDAPALAGGPLSFKGAARTAHDHTTRSCRPHRQWLLPVYPPRTNAVFEGPAQATNARDHPVGRELRRSTSATSSARYGRLHEV